MAHWAWLIWTTMASILGTTSLESPPGLLSSTDPQVLLDSPANARVAVKKKKKKKKKNTPRVHQPVEELLPPLLSTESALLPRPEAPVDPLPALPVETPPEPAPRPALTAAPAPAPALVAPNPSAAGSAHAAPSETPLAGWRRQDPQFQVQWFAGLMLPRSLQIQPATTLGFLWEVGQRFGWKGFFVLVEAQTSYGHTLLDETPYLMLDSLLAPGGRFRINGTRLDVGLGMGLRNMFLIRKQDSGNSVEGDPAQGFGAVAFCSWDFPLTRLLSLMVRADLRYMMEPLTARFRFDSTYQGGMGFSF